MILSDVIENIVKNQIRISIEPIIDSYNPLSYISYMHIDITDGNKKFYLFSDVYIDLNRDYIIKVGFHKGDKDPKYRHGLRVIDNNITSDLEYYLTKKLTKTKMTRNKDYEDIEISDSYSYNVNKWFI